jgi:uncharacterized protein
MKVLIVSDSHGLTQELSMIKERHSDAGAMIHCGDSELKKSDPQMDRFLAVRGNCDLEKFPEDLIQELDGIRFLITHGHLYNVKMTLMNLSYKAEETEASVICFGHSHLAGVELTQGKLFINPGSIRLPRRISAKTYVLLELNGNEVQVDFYDLEGNLLNELSGTYQLS